MRLLHLALNDARGKEMQKRHTFLFIQFSNRRCPVKRDMGSNARKARGDEMSAVGSAHFAHERILNSPGIINDEEHATRTDSRVQRQCPGFVAGKRSHFCRRDAEQRSPATKHARNVGCRSQTSPEHTITKLCSYCQIMR